MNKMKYYTCIGFSRDNDKKIKTYKLTKYLKNTKDKDEFIEYTPDQIKDMLRKDDTIITNLTLTKDNKIAQRDKINPSLDCKVYVSLYLYNSAIYCNNSAAIDVHGAEDTIISYVKSNLDIVKMQIKLRKRYKRICLSFYIHDDGMYCAWSDAQMHDFKMTEVYPALYLEYEIGGLYGKIILGNIIKNYNINESTLDICIKRAIKYLDIFIGDLSTPDEQLRLLKLCSQYDDDEFSTLQKAYDFMQRYFNLSDEQLLKVDEYLINKMRDKIAKSKIEATDNDINTLKAIGITSIDEVEEINESVIEDANSIILNLKNKEYHKITLDALDELGIFDNV